MPTVWVTQESNHVDYFDAERYGDLEFVTADEIKPMPSSIKNSRIFAEIDAALSKFKPDDYLVLTGNPATIGYCFHKAAEATGGQPLNVLLWDRIRSAYRLITIEV